LSNKATLACDVDSTIWDTGVRVREVVLETTGDTLDLEVVSTFAHILDVYGEPTTAEIFARVLSPERVHEREPYPGSVEVLRRLQEERGIKVHFITRNHDPGAMAPRLEPWLKEHFGAGVGLTVTTGDKFIILRDLSVFGLIDDRPEILERVANAGLWAAAKIQPWNRDLVAERADVRGFSDWREVPNLLPVL
jgi:5' nucleotidase, deoxy (Pyrimidine), cytosolic type C protein (NT5C)